MNLLSNMIKKIEDKKILDILKKKNVFVLKNNDVLDKLAELEKQKNKLDAEFNANMSKAKIYDEKVRPLILDLVSKTVIGEYDELSRVFLDVDDTWKLEFVDRLEEFKKLFKDRIIKKK